jgi:hypothetical protein
LSDSKHDLKGDSWNFVVVLGSVHGCFCSLFLLPLYGQLSLHDILLLNHVDSSTYKITSNQIKELVLLVIYKLTFNEIKQLVIYYIYLFRYKNAFHLIMNVEIHSLFAINQNFCQLI